MLRNLMGSAQNNSDPESMLRYVETIVSLDPETVEERWLRAVLRFQTGRHVEALEDIERVLEENPENVDLQPVRQLQIIIQREMQNADRK